MQYRKQVLLFTVAAFATLCQAQEMGSLSVKAHPGRAGVFVDGKYLGPAANFRVARTYAVAAGDHELKLIDPRYEELTTKVTVTKGKKTTLSETLKELPPPKPPFGKIRTESPDKFAAVYVNDRFMGHTDEFSNGSQADRKEHAVKAMVTFGRFNSTLPPLPS